MHKIFKQGGRLQYGMKRVKTWITCQEWSLRIKMHQRVFHLGARHLALEDNGGHLTRPSSYDTGSWHMRVRETVIQVLYLSAASNARFKWDNIHTGTWYAIIWAGIKRRCCALCKNSIFGILIRASPSFSPTLFLLMRDFWNFRIMRFEDNKEERRGKKNEIEILLVSIVIELHAVPACKLGMFPATDRDLFKEL